MCKLEIHCLLSRFLEIPRNRLAARYCPPGGTNCLVQFSRIFGFLCDVGKSGVIL